MSWDTEQSPDLAWRLAGDLPRGTSDSDLDAVGGGVLLQDEPRIRIVLFTNAENSSRQVSKIYRTPMALTWRDLFRYPQAQREIENLQYAFAKGLPVAEPLSFGLSRRPGRDWYSQLTTAFLKGKTLRELLAIQPDSQEALVSGAGQLLAAMHEAGMVWGTAHSGNFMVDADSGGARGALAQTAFDVPYALCTGKKMTGSRFALYDVWSLAEDFRALCRLSEQQVASFFEAYAAGAGIDAGELKFRVDALKGKKSVFWQRLYIRNVRSFRLRPM